MHEQIPTLFAHFTENQQFYLVEEYIEGLSLTQELNQVKCCTVNQVKFLLEEILDILSFIHAQGVIHRDIKPDNIIRRGSDGKLVLIDFGAVKETNTTNLNSVTVSVRRFIYE